MAKFDLDQVNRVIWDTWFQAQALIKNYHGTRYNVALRNNHELIRIFVFVLYYFVRLLKEIYYKYS